MAKKVWDGILLGIAFGVLLAAANFSWLTSIVTTITDAIAGAVGATAVSTVEKLFPFKYAVMGLIGGLIGLFIEYS